MYRIKSSNSICSDEEYGDSLFQARRKEGFFHTSNETGWLSIVLSVVSYVNCFDIN